MLDSSGSLERAKPGRDQRGGKGGSEGRTKVGARVVVELRGSDSGGALSGGRSKWVGREKTRVSADRASENRETGDIEIGLGRVPLVM